MSLGWDSWGCPMQGQERDSMILGGPIQCRRFYDSMNSVGFSFSLEIMFSSEVPQKGV